MIQDLWSDLGFQLRNSVVNNTGVSEPYQTSKIELFAKIVNGRSR